MKGSFRSTWLDIRDGIRSQPGRFGVACLAIGLGMAVLTVLISILSGLNMKSKRLSDELGANVVAILSQNDRGRNSQNLLHEDHAAFLEKNLPGSIVSMQRSYKVPTLGTKEMLSVVATDSSLLQVRQWPMLEGRFLDKEDINKRERHIVVSRSLSERWGWKVGDLVMLDRFPFKVIGLLAPGGGGSDAEVGDAGLLLGENVVFIPNSIRPFWEKKKVWTAGSVDALYLKIPDNLDVDQALPRLQALFSQPGFKVEGLSFVTPASLVAGIKSLQKTLASLVGSVALLAIVLGGITLMTLMLENIRSRVMEIGLRRAMGATGRDIAVLFVSEALLVTFVATLAGTVLSLLLLFLKGDLLPVEINIGTGSVLIPLVTALILTLVFSYWPARLAAAISPSEALRNE